MRLDLLHARSLREQAGHELTTILFLHKRNLNFEAFQ